MKSVRKEKENLIEGLDSRIHTVKGRISNQENQAEGLSL